MASDGAYETQSEAIVAALDEMEEGDTIYVHDQDCLFSYGACTCEPRIWTY